jgi:hypothetical protein
MWPGCQPGLVSAVLPFTPAAFVFAARAVRFARCKTWGGGNDTALQVEKVALADAGRVAVLIDNVGCAEIEEPFAMLVYHLLLPRFDGQVTGGLDAGIGVAGSVHRRAAPPGTIA